MNSRLSTDLNLDSLSNHIEVQIFYNELGAPYCEFFPRVHTLSRTEFLPELDFMAKSSSIAVSKLNRYMLAEGGYPEMYPGDEDD